MKSRVGLLVTLSVIALMWVLHTASKNFVVDPDFTVFLGNKDIQLPSIALWFMMIRIHIILAIIALITGPLGLSLSIRMKRPALHRWNVLEVI
ncbi:hypothetical protein [Paenibacillus sp. SYP-B4298]|uniref:hypothetical protein n=1 Tax=Paenibacillus sp. SYP-B4298 TaxID=2996034 RepID=UPI0022DD3379|nr:hypothetical protein [Paenibacillus sp. SYP-B4298]